MSNTINRCGPTRSLSHETLGSSFFSCSRVLLSFHLEPSPPAGPSMLALPAIAASELPAPTPSCPADHLRDGHACKLGSLECAFERAGHRRYYRHAQPGTSPSPHISLRTRACSEPLRPDALCRLHAKSDLLAPPSLTPPRCCHHLSVHIMNE